MFPSSRSFVIAAVVAGSTVVAAGLGAGIVGRSVEVIDTPAPVVVRTPVPVTTLRFDDAVRQAQALPRLRSLLVSVDGYRAVEEYFHGATAGRMANLKSASKSVIATLVGVAIDRGAIGGVHDRIDRYLPADLPDDPATHAITVEDLLTMRSGLETTSNRNYGRWVSSGNWVRFALRQPMVDEPGGRMIYSTGSTHLLSAILTRATGKSTLAFAREALGGPLHIDFAPWTRDPQGIYLGGNEMPMRPRDMLTLGEVYLNDGRYEDRQVVPAAWVRTSIVPRTTSRWSNREYGYGWWIRSFAGTPAYYAWGYGGQFIFVLPSLRTVVVTTSVPEPGGERRDHLDAIYDLVERTVVPVAEAAFPSPG